MHPVLRHLRVRLPWVLLALTAACLNSLLTVLLALYTGKFPEHLMAYRSLRGRLFDHLPWTFWETPQGYFLGFAGLLLLWALTQYLGQYLLARLGSSWTYDVRQALFARQLTLPLATAQEKGIGRYLLRWSGDLNSLRRYLTHGILRASSDLLLLLAGTIALGCLYWPLVLLLPATALLLWPLWQVLGRALYAQAARHRDARSGLLSHVYQRLAGLATVQAFNRERAECQRFDRVSRRVYRHALGYHRLRAGIETLVNLGQYLSIGGAMVLLLLRPGQTSPGALLATFLLLLTLRPVIRRLLRVPVYWKLGHLSMNKLQSVLELGQGTAGLAPLVAGTGVLALRGFGGVAAEIAPGTTFRWPGHVQDGQALFRVLTALTPAEPGRLMLDGQDLAQVAPDSLRRRVAGVGPTWPLVGRTVLEAISRSRSPQARERAARVLDWLGASLPPGSRLQLDQRIGELGIRLSPVQRLCLALARAELAATPIVLLDLDIHALDSRALRLLQACLDTWALRKTLVILSPEPTDPLSLLPFKLPAISHN